MIDAGPRRQLFRVLGTPVSADFGALLLLALVLVGWSRGGGAQAIAGAAIVALVGFVSIVAHELGHAVAVRRLGYGRSEIVLGMMGGLCIWRGRPTHWHRVLVALAGPAVSIALGVAGLVALRALPAALTSDFVLGTVLRGLAILNLAWAIFNLLPIYPMDGGQALRSLLAMKLPWRRALEVSLIVSLVACVAVGVWIFSAGLTFGAVLLGLFAWRNLSELNGLRAPRA
jgi:stage IV sporulation protein FB